MVEYSWSDVTGVSHTHRKPQIITVLKCVCVCIHITGIWTFPLYPPLCFTFILLIPSYLIFFHSCSNHPTLKLFLIQRAYRCPFSWFSKVFWPQWTAAGFSILSSLCDSSPRTLPPRQSQLPHTLSNTKYAIQTQRHNHTHKPSHVHLTEVHANALIYMHKCAHGPMRTHTKGRWSHFCGMS